jgi:hypothetical protein
VKTPVNVYFCCLGVAKGNYTLRDWLNVELFELHRGGTIDWPHGFQSAGNRLVLTRSGQAGIEYGINHVQT